MREIVQGIWRLASNALGFQSSFSYLSGFESLTDGQNVVRVSGDEG